MQVKILSDCRVSEDAFTVRKLHKDDIITLAHTAACSLIWLGKAERLTEEN